MSCSPYVRGWICVKLNWDDPRRIKDFNRPIFLLTTNPKIYLFCPDCEQLSCSHPRRMYQNVLRNSVYRLLLSCREGGRGQDSRNMKPLTQPVPSGSRLLLPLDATELTLCADCVRVQTQILHPCLVGRGWGELFHTWLHRCS